MGTKAGVGTSHHRNPRIAGREAVEQALESSQIDRPDFIFMFATVGYDQQILVRTVRAATGDAPLCGCSSEGTIAGDDTDESSFSVAIMTIRSDKLRFSHGLATGLREDPAGVGRTIANAIRPDLRADTLALFVFPDGLTVNFERFRVGLEDQLHLDYLLPLLGGTAADNMAVERTYQYCDDQVRSDAVAWSLLSGRAQIAWAVNHGCISMGIRHTVTQAEGNVIYEIDGKPALETLRDYLSDDEVADWSSAMPNFPLGFEAAADMIEAYDPFLIRAMMTRDEATGAVSIPTEVSAGTSIWMTRRDYAKILAGVERLASQIERRLGDNLAKLVFQFDCAGRGKIFLREQQRSHLLRLLRQRIGSDVPWLGFYTYGEIGPVGNHNHFHNYTAVVTAIY